MHSSILKNTAWILKLSFRSAPVISAAQIVGFINSNISGLLRAFIVGLVIDWLIAYSNNPQDATLIQNSLIVFGAYYLFNSAANTASNYGNNLIKFKIAYEVPENLLHEKLHRLGSAALEDPTVQNLVTRYRENKYTFSEHARYLFTITGMFVSLLIALVPLLAFIPVATIALVLVSIPAFFTNKIVLEKLWQLDKDTTVLNRRGSNLVHQLNNPTELKEIKQLNAYEYLRGYFLEYVDKYFGRKLILYRNWTIYDLLNSLLAGVVILFGIYNLVELVIAKTITVGQIAFFLSALTGIGSYIDGLSANIASYFATNKRVQEMRELLNWPEPDNSNKLILDRLKEPPHLKLSHVDFKYPGSEKLVLSDLNLEIKPGEKIAIVGENGAGKTTLIKLISRVYPVTQGEIKVDEINLNDIEEGSWFRNLGVLHQDFNTYNDLTAFENIALGRIDEELNYSEIEEAAKKADAYDFIINYQNNFSQVLSERYEDGIRPSTGQWQKIAIARFFYRNAPILILDEPTASIDAVAEANIFDRIYKFIEDKTVIIISHRFATVRSADRIIVFDKGKIIEEGSHEELLKLNGKYSHAFNLQAEGYH